MQTPANQSVQQAQGSRQSQPAAVRRLTTAGLMQDQREVEIEHAGRIYRLRITQLNKLILTA
ncbi:hemin uptake protein hemP [Pseudoduganella lurida]|uniref:Hemin uptake protein hemP n=1 Tax=Pseudoduganella lurida TaxID=1036180 RepID=A0A562R1F3_9BURK|nr:hemin uptake protein HemP [Pseudoduganella lurida]TWI62206.1 hemin uptake protein hemP [Pseudoduganella lurida]